MGGGETGVAGSGAGVQRWGQGGDAAERRPRASRGVGEGKIDAASWEEAMQMLWCAD